MTAVMVMMVGGLLALVSLAWALQRWNKRMNIRPHPRELGPTATADEATAADARAGTREP